MLRHQDAYGCSVLGTTMRESCVAGATNRIVHQRWVAVSDCWITPWGCHLLGMKANMVLTFSLAPQMRLTPRKVRTQSKTFRNQKTFRCAPTASSRYPPRRPGSFFEPQSQSDGARNMWGRRNGFPTRTSRQLDAKLRIWGSLVMIKDISACLVKRQSR